MKTVISVTIQIENMVILVLFMSKKMRHEGHIHALAGDKFQNTKHHISLQIFKTKQWSNAAGV